MVKKQNILIIGSGGREHALGWKLKQSPNIDKIFFAPGSPGTALIGVTTNIPALDFATLVAYVKKNNINFTVAGPDDILAAGIVNYFQKNGLKIFGATKEAAQIESSKAFAKQLMTEENIPTSRYATFTDFTKAKKYITKHPLPIVIKASGLALGKGVIIAQTKKDAEKVLSDIMVKKIFGKAGDEVVIEEFLQGKEISIHVFSDGEHIVMFPPSRDHKPIFDGNKGPNTGGMGTVAPVPKITKKQMTVIKNTIVLPAIKGMKKRGIPFIGLLYPGLMMTKTGPKVIEFNSRFGDPECQSYVRLLQSDLYPVLTSCTNGTLNKQKISWSKQSACCIMLASKGYPESSQKGIPLLGLDKTMNQNTIVVFHSGTKQDGKQIVTNGGRVLGITAIGKTLHDALKNAYAQIGSSGIHFEGMQYRKDIGK